MNAYLIVKTLIFNQWERTAEIVPHWFPTTSAASLHIASMKEDARLQAEATEGYYMETYLGWHDDDAKIELRVMMLTQPEAVS